MLHAAITLPGGTDGLWTLLFVPASIVIAAIGGAMGIVLTRRESGSDVRTPEGEEQPHGG
jgi:hypothetical protein